MILLKEENWFGSWSYIAASDFPGTWMIPPSLKYRSWVDLVSGLTKKFLRTSRLKTQLRPSVSMDNIQCSESYPFLYSVPPMRDLPDLSRVRTGAAGMFSIRMWWPYLGVSDHGI